MSGFNVSIVAGKDKDSSSVKVEGSVQHIITDAERGTFRLNDAQLKDAVQKSFGKRPNDAYLHSSTPWGDLYRRYNWQQTSTVVTAVSGEILDVTSKPVALATKTLENHSSHEATFTANLSETVADTVTSTWNVQRTLSVNQKIKYEIGFLGTGGGGETDISFSQSWGEGGSESKTVTVGSSAGVSVTLKPHQSVEATLTASRGVMKVRLRYGTRLTGYTAINYNPTYKGHHFWALWLPSVMAAAQIPNSVETTEDIELDYYSNGKVEIKDKASNETIDSYSLMLAHPGIDNNVDHND